MGPDAGVSPVQPSNPQPFVKADDDVTSKGRGNIYGPSDNIPPRQQGTTLPMPPRQSGSNMNPGSSIVQAPPALLQQPVQVVLTGEAKRKLERMSGSEFVRFMMGSAEQEPTASKTTSAQGNPHP